MKDIILQILGVYFSKMREPNIDELQIDEKYLSQSGCCFVTLYLNGEVHGSAGNVKEIHSNIAGELIANTLQALTKDTRFQPLTLEDSEKIQFRVDMIEKRDMIALKDISALDPVKVGLIAIHREYDKLAVLLPNMSGKIMTGDDMKLVLQNKLDDQKLSDKNYILYKIETSVDQNF